MIVVIPLGNAYAAGLHQNSRATCKRHAMVLLQWVVLEPQGPGSIAAVRFSSPVRVRSLRIFPTGARPFKLQEDIVAFVFMLF